MNVTLIVTLSRQIIKKTSTELVQRQNKVALLLKNIIMIEN